MQMNETFSDYAQLCHNELFLMLVAGDFFFVVEDIIVIETYIFETRN